ncbi:MAG: hypothetical protein Q8R28_00850, partial [Dehalococcoidia bacterium]|nr:hypothetical protein [Dehalococcoidia bacterium]
EGVTEAELVVSFFDEAEGAWEQIPEEAVIEVDTQNNTITVATTHASYWAVMDNDGVDATATAVRAIGWGGLKGAVKR